MATGFRMIFVTDPGVNPNHDRGMGCTDQNNNGSLHTKRFSHLCI